MYDSLQWSVDSTRKRAREEDETVNVATGFNEHRNKRLHSLPLRSSPNQKRWSGPPSFSVSQLPPLAATPSDSDSEELQQQNQQLPEQQLPSHFSPWLSATALSLDEQPPNPPMDVDRDTDMMAVEETQHLNPGLAQPDPTAPSITGRMPTPIHATFAAQVRGNSWAVSNASNAYTGAGTGMPRPFPVPRDSSVPRSIESVAEWSIVQTRRLPSPISESGGEEAPTSPGMVLDSTPNLQRPYLPHLPHSTNPAMAHPNVEIVTPRVSADDIGMMDTEDGQDHSPTSAPATPSPRSKFGHSRSKHTLNSWTLQPGMKKSFSIGYRADCEKCRLKIPGHFNHIIVS